VNLSVHSFPSFGTVLGTDDEAGVKTAPSSAEPLHTRSARDTAYPLRSTRHPSRFDPVARLGNRRTEEVVNERMIGKDGTMRTIRVKVIAASTICVLAGVVATLGAPFKW